MGNKQNCNERKNMNLSIVIPHFNSPDYLERLLQSIVSENDTCQIIVVDDNSNMDLEKYKTVQSTYSGRVEFYSNDSGVKGAGAARNIGLKHITGDWLMFADSDDTFCPGWNDIVVSYENSDFDLVYFTPTTSIEREEAKGDRHEAYAGFVEDYLNNTKDGELLLRYFFIVPWSKLYRTSLIKEHNISFEEVMYSNDVMFSTMTGYYASRITAFRETIYSVTEKADSLIQNISEESWSIRHEVFCRKNLFLRKHLNRADYTLVTIKMGSFGRLVGAVQKHFGMKNYCKYVKMYFKYRVPVFRSMLFTVKRKIKRTFHKGK